ncbi:fructosamine kinase family protein [Qipengyuania atrilutea]|uniref:Fructosamine kinase family protein n=1 Tax=Qipengyuania atrilutea TaxID=2744473 RepID=A0A850HAW2_9SPHN|nr:fructosamine kinase family protein [Actirhodobacter atriluteus]NVD44209.1 fructosamine kinase family protein [Actirhodobacter atriluteus]
MAAIEDLAKRLTGQAVTSVERFAGGDISGASKVKLADGTMIVAKSGPVVAEESRMLEAMRRAGAPVPRVLACENDVLLIDYVTGAGALSGDAWISLAEALTKLRQPTRAQYGWNEDYALRHVAVENDRAEDWPTFWAERRLLCHVPHLESALARRIEALAKSLPDLLPASPPAALLHGDLWGGNILVSGKNISLIDPNAYYGDREVDAATLTVFDSPAQAFFDALDLEPGWEKRQPIYRLWIWLIHVRLFGGGYEGSAMRDLDTLGF